MRDREREKKRVIVPVIRDSVIFHSFSVFPAKPATSAPKLYISKFSLKKSFSFQEKNKNSNEKQ